MRKRVDYLPLCEQGLELVKITRVAMQYLQSFEHTSSIRKQLSEIEELTLTIEMPIKEELLIRVHKVLFESTLELLAEIYDSLKHLLLSQGDMMSKLARLPVEEREYVCDLLDIEFEPSKDRMSHDLQELVRRLMDKMKDLQISADRYYSFDDEKFVDFEDEMNN